MLEDGQDGLLRLGVVHIKGLERAVEAATHALLEGAKGGIATIGEDLATETGGTTTNTPVRLLLRTCLCGRLGAGTALRTRGIDELATVLTTGVRLVAELVEAREDGLHARRRVPRSEEAPKLGLAGDGGEASPAQVEVGAHGSHRGSSGRHWSFTL